MVNGFRAGSVAGMNFVFCLFIWEISARSTGMKCKKQNQNGGTYTCIVRDRSSFVDSRNSTVKANWDTSEVVIHARQNLCMLRKQSYFVKMFRLGHP